MKAKFQLSVYLTTAKDEVDARQILKDRGVIFDTIKDSDFWLTFYNEGEQVASWTKKGIAWGRLVC